MKNPSKCMLSKLILMLMLSGMNFSLLAATSDMVDPTRPPREMFTPQSQQSPLQLMAIFISNGKKIAIINNQIVKIGDEIGELTITQIRTNAVELRGPQKKEEILYLTPMLKQNKR